MPTLHPADGGGASPSTLKIWCIGDSITQGGVRHREEYTYRLPLQRLLHQRGIAADFVGTQTGGLDSDATWPDVIDGVPFDPHHDGYYGWTTSDVVAEVRTRFDRLAAVPDIVLIHLGTNDQRDGAFEMRVGAPLREFIAFLRKHNPRVALLLGHLNFKSSPAADAIRAVVDTVVADLTMPGSPIITVPHYQGWNENPGHPETDTFDWVHPNLRGQEKMAKAWLTAIEPLLNDRR